MREKLTKKQAELVERYIPLAKTLARRQQAWNTPTRPDFADQVSVAYLALCDAARTWDPERGPFEPHARVLIGRALVTADRRHQHITHIPDSGHRLLGRARRAIREGAQTPAEVAAAINATIAAIEGIWPHINDSWEDLDAASDLASQNPDPAQVAEDSDEERRVRLAVRLLPYNQRDVIEHRFGWSTGAPLLASEIAELLEIPVEAVHALEVQAMANIKRTLIGESE